MAGAELKQKSSGGGEAPKAVPDDGSGGDVGSKLRKLIEENGEDEKALTDSIREMMASWQGPIARLVLAKVFDEEKAEKLWEGAFGAAELSPPPQDEQVPAGAGAQLALAQAGDLGSQLFGSLKQMTAAPEALMAPLHAAQPNIAAATMSRLHQQKFDQKRSAYQVLDELTQGGAKTLLAKGGPEEKQEQKLDLRTGAAKAWASKIVAAMSQKGAIDSALQVASNAPAWASMRLALRQEPSQLPAVVQTLLDEVENLLRDVGSQEIVPAELASRIAGVIGPVTARLHTGPEANLAAQAEGAAAVAIGEDVFVADGQFKPGTPEGDFLIAHELAHVVQAQQKSLQKAAPLAISSGRVVDEAEVEADLRARLVVARGNYNTQVPSGPAASGMAESDGQREAQVAAQQQRLQLASEGAGAGGAAEAAPEAAVAPEPAAPVVRAPAESHAAAGAGSAQAYTATFQKSPSEQTTEWDAVGDKASDALRNEEERAVAQVPSLDAELEGKDAGQKAGDAGAGGNAKLDAKGDGADATATPARMPTLPPPIANAQGASQLEDRAGGDKTRLKTEGLKAISELQVSDPSLKTNPGPSPVVELTGTSDPVQTKAAEEQSRQQTDEELEKQRDKILSGPGPAQVQPVKIEEKLKLSTGDLQIGPMPTLPPVDGMALFKGWKSTSDATLKSAFDDIARPKLDASVQPAKDKLMQSAEERDQTRSKLIDDTQSKTALANAEAQAKQQSEVAGARAKIATEQQNTLAKQKAAVADVESKANTKRAAVTQQIDARVQADQQQIQNQYKDAQLEADSEQRRGEDEARQKREQAEREANEGSWWDRAVNAISSAISAVASAIDSVLSAVASAVGHIIDAVKDAACALIDAARNFIVAAIGEFGHWLQDLVSATIGQVFPELAAELNRAIDGAVQAATAAVNAIADGLKSAVTALCDTLKAGINAAINAFRAAVQVAAAFATALVTGDWETVGRMLLEAALRLCGIDPAAFYALIGEARETIHLILDDPGAFAGHVVDAVKQGFSQFGDNFLTHLRDGIVQWLFGTFANAGITLPQQFDIAGVFDLVCQVLGLTYPRLRQKAVRLIGEQNVERIEFVWGYVQELLTNGWAGVWERVQNDLGNLWSTVIDGAKSWLLQHVVQAAILRLATMFNPVGALVNLLMTAWNVYQWVRENAQRLFGLIEAVVHSMTEIAHGNIQNAANFIEGSLARLVPIAISLLANLLGLGGIADRIREIIESIQATVDHALDQLIERVMAMFRGGGGKDKKEEKKDVKGWGDMKVEFEDDSKEQHHLWIDYSEPRAKLMVASEPPEPVRTATAQSGHLPVDEAGRGEVDTDTQQVEDLATAHGRPEGEGGAPPATPPAGGDANQARELAERGVANLREALRRWGPTAKGRMLKFIEHSAASPLVGVGTRDPARFGQAAPSTLKYSQTSAGPWMQSHYKELVAAATNAKEPSASAANYDLTAAPHREVPGTDIRVSNVGDRQYTLLRPTDTPHVPDVVDLLAAAVDPAVREAMAACGNNIITFMTGMVASGAVGSLTLEAFNGIWEASTSTRRWLGDRLRAAGETAMMRPHEWIPCAMIQTNITRARAADRGGDVARAAQWIELQNNLRCDTRSVIFNTSKGRLEHDPSSGGDAWVLNGHTGALYFRGDAASRGEPGFHTALENAFGGAATPHAAVVAAYAVFEAWVWNGAALDKPLHSELTVGSATGPSAADTDVAGNQRTAYNDVNDMFIRLLANQSLR